HHMGRSHDEYKIQRARPHKVQLIRCGDAVLVDYRSGYGTQVLENSDVQDVLVEEVPDATFDDIGGLGEQIEQIRDSGELPFQYPELYQQHQMQPPKRILLYVPPGTGNSSIDKLVTMSYEE